MLMGGSFRRWIYMRNAAKNCEMMADIKAVACSSNCDAQEENVVIMSEVLFHRRLSALPQRRYLFADGGGFWNVPMHPLTSSKDF